MSLQGNPGANIAVCAAAAADQKRIGKNSLRQSNGQPRIRYLEIAFVLTRDFCAVSVVQSDNKF
jgi:hypothetical protein